MNDLCKTMLLIRIILVLNTVPRHGVSEEKKEGLVIREVAGPYYQLLAHAKIVITLMSKGTKGEIVSSNAEGGLHSRFFLGAPSCCLRPCMFEFFGAVNFPLPGADQVMYELQWSMHPRIIQVDRSTLPNRETDGWTDGWSFPEPDCNKLREDPCDKRTDKPRYGRTD